MKAITRRALGAEEFLGVANGRLKFSAKKASNGQPHPVEGRRHIGRTKRRQRRVIEIDMEVGQHRAARFQAVDPFEGLADREMRTVPLVAQRVDDPQIEVFEILDALGRDRVEIGRIGQGAASYRRCESRARPCRRDPAETASRGSVRPAPPATRRRPSQGDARSTAADKNCPAASRKYSRTWPSRPAPSRRPYRPECAGRS